ncbi:MAG: SprT family zinc-dependent metalloprotease [Lachnospiraceae bacterium]|nr:SprT family zinc-dependent metalloprotease [Lachnospiraceae bacterium]
MAQITIHNHEEEITINVVVMNARFVDFKVDNDLSVELRVPAGMSWTMIRRYVMVHQEEIFREYDKKKMRNHQSLPGLLDMDEGRIIYRSGLRLPFLGQMNMTLRVKYVADSDETQMYVSRDPSNGGRILTIRTNSDDQNFIRYCIMRYYKKCAAQIITHKVKEYGQKLQLKYNHVRITEQMVKSPLLHPRLNYRNIEIKNQKTLWGSCNRKRNLKFDWKLIMLPIEVVDYIIVHELTHLKKMSHSKAFWNEIETVMPEYKECKAWLDHHGAEYEIF